MLIVLDHATGSDQVLPLLPGSTEALVLITSRRLTAQTQAVPLTLEILEAGRQPNCSPCLLAARLGPR